MIKTIKYYFLRIIFLVISPFYMVLCVFAAVLSRVLRRNNTRPRLVWGSAPIINNSYWSDAMREAGFDSVTYTNSYFSTINRRDDWDRILQEEYRLFPLVTKPMVAFIDSFFRYDVFFLSFNGFFIGQTSLWWFQAYAFKLAGKKVVVMPYGSDSYVYRRIRSTSVIHGLMMSYPQGARKQERISRDVEYWCKHADVVIPGLMGPDGFGRWDVLMPSQLVLPLHLWKPSKRKSNADGDALPVRIAHAPNHRGFKGTEFVIDAVKQLKNEGLKVELVLLENMQNSEVRDILFQQADILIEQLIFGHGMNAVEGMASGLPVISNFEDETYTLPFRRWSYLDECPIVSASPEIVVETLRKLVTRPDLRQQLGSAGREYVEKYHSYEACQYLFGEVIEYLYGQRESLINLYHPLLGEYPKCKPRVEHPLVNSHIVD